ncbi:FAD:protein FMN transferase [Brevundimonas variabilis]|uniref:FAD:protein FMN transferase n=1 Tax=Brevundimonas variabilis TaxID=74312 RepID=A0A7W9CIN9_9CAUL|nr:FAD:protein FMN transferase [Brevundimonas variabilis]MBB5746378.1 thiamine biosynthesis lipoprotein [Brevundimonas variabilis]
MDRQDNRVLIPPTDRAPSRPPSDLIWALHGQTMGTTWSVRAVPAPGTVQADLQSAIQSELDSIVALFSPWEPDSEIRRFNLAPAGTWALSGDFWDLLISSMELADDTDGAVDPTLGALVDLWGFGPPGPREDLPTDDEIGIALGVSGWQKLRLHRAGQAAVQPGGLFLDFSGIAKGHAVDRVSERLTALGATAHLVEIGGELRGMGVKPDAQPWWVEIEQPPGSQIPRTVAALFDVAVATSGDYRRAFIHEDRLYPHTLNGRTGRPVDNGVTSVTVFHTSAMRADALATALTVMGPEDGPAYAEAMGLNAHFVCRTEKGLVERMTPGFAAMMDDDVA